MACFGADAKRLSAELLREIKECFGADFDALAWGGMLNYIGD